ncbi:MAG: CPBP family intramembrane metalloprotease [Planctomycetia bacterium]|nr:CPBP family intramembrane metalloprotease [Planctomycetia bacterium]
MEQRQPQNSPFRGDPFFQERWAFWRYLYGFLAPERRRSALILLYAVVAVALWSYIPKAPRLLEASPTGEVAYVAPVGFSPDLSFGERVKMMILSSQKIWGALLFFCLIPMGIIRFVFRERIADYGLGFGVVRLTLLMSLAMSPVFILVGYFSGALASMLTTYPYSPWILGGERTIGDGKTFMALYFALYFFVYYFSWEFFFRGFLQLGLDSSLGSYNAILIGTAMSTVAHFGHAFPEVLGAVLGGLFWGFWVYRTRSLFFGWWSHALLGIALDFMLIRNFL